jgi:hypothetical protein
MPALKSSPPNIGPLEVKLFLGGKRSVENIKANIPNIHNQGERPGGVH